MTTTMDNMIGNIITAYNNMITAYHDMTNNNVPTLSMLQSYFGNSFTTWNTQWREDVAVSQFRLARSFLRSGIILHMLFEDWYTTSVVNRRKPMNEGQLRNARIKCEKVVHHFTQCQNFFTKGKDNFGMNFAKMGISVPNHILAQVDFPIVDNMKRRFASIGFCALVELWLEHNEQLSLQYRYLIMNLTEEVAPIMLNGRDLLQKRIEECLILFETDQEEYQYDLNNLDKVMATPRTPNPLMAGIYSPKSSPVVNFGSTLVVPGASPSNRKISSRSTPRFGNVTLEVPNLIRVDLPKKGEGISIEIPQDIDSPATGPVSATSLDEREGTVRSPLHFLPSRKQIKLKNPEKLGFRQLLLKNAQKVKGKQLSPGVIWDSVNSSLKSPLPPIEHNNNTLKPGPRIITNKVYQQDNGIHFNLNGGLTPQSETLTYVPLPPVPRTERTLNTMEILKKNDKQ
jgi:hypothetical protein